ncbi:MAG: carboxypeptidase-like regulatory domain-containing protein [Bryobacteraceae bacterium]
MREYAVHPSGPVRFSDSGSNRRFIGLMLTVLAISCLTAGPVYGQAATSGVDGTVLDASSAAVPGADVVVANTQTGFERKLQTTGAGLFTMPDLTPGPGYTVTVTKTGFTKYQVNEFSLAVGQTRKTSSIT